MFFSGSTHRWRILLTNVEVTVKKLSGTRYSAHYEAVKPVFKCFKKNVDAVEELCDASETIETRGAAQTLLPVMFDFSFSCFLCLCNNVFKEVNHVQKYLQILGISFDKSVSKMRSLKVFLKDKRNYLVEQALQFVKDTCEEMGIPVVKRTVRRKKIMPGERRLQTSR
ncbi:hypothetical protein AVEN_16181-1 [Araneus ventricosus]|uniref:Uncharacterized protein n=1 Tax=Araneus ventricosus TaxID=182803 RepID=A0A4Y2DSX9_ARAVE|nr:hypothetical protein AVEN_223932-1 [Araneus ventricosus]GBM18859.1 hypothetical protein AVEN_16181-1 [Araneus ventricosus]